MIVAGTDWASSDPSGAKTVVTLASAIAFRHSTSPLLAKPNTANSAVMPFSNKLSGCTW